MQIRPSQIARLGDYVNLTTTTDPSSGSVVIQSITGQKTYTVGSAINRVPDAPSTPGRFDSQSEEAAIALFGLEVLGDRTSGIGFWGGDTNSAGTLWWTPLNPYARDFGYFSFTHSEGTPGFDASTQGKAGINAYYLMLDMIRLASSPTVSPYTFGTPSSTLWPPSDTGAAKLFVRPGSEDYGFEQSPINEPSLAVSFRNLDNTVRTETLATIEQLTDHYAPVSSVYIAELSPGASVPIFIAPYSCKIKAVSFCANTALIDSSPLLFDLIRYSGSLSPLSLLESPKALYSPGIQMGYSYELSPDTDFVLSPGNTLFLNYSASSAFVHIQNMCVSVKIGL